MLPFEEKSVVSYLPLSLPVRMLIFGEYQNRKQVRFLAERTREIDVVGECGTGAEALAAIEEEAPDLLCLDVGLPELAELALLEATPPERCPQVLCLTTADHKLQRAFEVHALDYLHKPLTDEAFYDGLRRVCRRVLQDRLTQERTTLRRVRSVLAQWRGRPHLDHGQVLIPEREAGMFRVIQAPEIDWIEAEDGGVRIHAGTESCWLRQTLAAVQRQLDRSIFLQIHRSRIVNRQRVTAVKRLCKGEYSVVLKGGRSLATGRTYRDVVRRTLETGLLPGRIESLDVERLNGSAGALPPRRPVAVRRNGAAPPADARQVLRASM